MATSFSLLKLKGREIQTIIQWLAGARPSWAGTQMFPDSKLRGNAELGDNNQVEVALVIYLFWLGK